MGFISIPCSILGLGFADTLCSILVVEASVDVQEELSKDRRQSSFAATVARNREVDCHSWIMQVASCTTASVLGSQRRGGEAA